MNTQKHSEVYEMHQQRRYVLAKQYEDMVAMSNPPRVNVDCGKIVLETNSDAILATLADEPVFLVRDYDGTLETVTEAEMVDDWDWEDRFYGQQDFLEW